MTQNYFNGKTISMDSQCMNISFCPAFWLFRISRIVVRYDVTGREETQSNQRVQTGQRKGDMRVLRGVRGVEGAGDREYF